MARILVVDDEAAVRRFLDEFLTSRGHTVVTVPDAHQALSVTAKQIVDLMILDISMRDENGLDFLKKLRGHHHKTPIIIYSGSITPSVEKDLRSAGANEVIAKGLPIKILEEQIQKVLSASEKIFEPRNDQKQKALLIVDDEAPIRHLLKDFFTSKKYAVFEAANGVEAVRIVSERQPAVVLLDFHMPGMNGLETLEKIKEIDPSVGVIMVTGHDDPASVQKAMEIGAYGYVLKPFDFVYLELVVMSKLIIASKP